MMAKNTDKKEESYQIIRAELDDVLVRLQDPASDVDEAVALYGQAIQLTAKLEAYLESAENRIKKVRVDFNTTAHDGIDDIDELVGPED